MNNSHSVDLLRWISGGSEFDHGYKGPTPLDSEVTVPPVSRSLVLGLVIIYPYVTRRLIYMPGINTTIGKKLMLHVTDGRKLM